MQEERSRRRCWTRRRKREKIAAFFTVSSVTGKDDRETEEDVLRFDVSVDNVQMMMKI
jgi:hypothetical protein